MEKTIMTGDRIFGFRLAYGINLDLFGHEISKKVKDPERFDIVIFKYPDDESQLFIKRVIGLPGEIAILCWVINEMNLRIPASGRTRSSALTRS